MKPLLCYFLGSFSTPSPPIILLLHVLISCMVYYVLISCMVYYKALTFFGYLILQAVCFFPWHLKLHNRNWSVFQFVYFRLPSLISVWGKAVKSPLQWISLALESIFGSLNFFLTFSDTCRLVMSLLWSWTYSPPLLSECWEFRCVPPYPACSFFIHILENRIHSLMKIHSVRHCHAVCGFFTCGFLSLNIFMKLVLSHCLECPVSRFPW